MTFKFFWFPALLSDCPVICSYASQTLTRRFGSIETQASSGGRTACQTWVLSKTILFALSAKFCWQSSTSTQESFNLGEWFQRWKDREWMSGWAINVILKTGYTGLCKVDCFCSMEGKDWKAVRCDSVGEGVNQENWFWVLQKEACLVDLKLFYLLLVI